MTIDALVVGAGPAGLATAASLGRAGARYRIVDRHGVAGGAYRLMDPDLVMTSPSRLITLLDAPTTGLDRYATAGAYARYLEALARRHGIAPERGVVETVTCAGDGFAVALGHDEVEARCVVLATGMFETPHVPVLAGRADVATVHAAAWRADLIEARQAVVVIGGASSAIEIAEAAARRGARVTVATHKLAMTRQTVLGVDPAHALFPVLARTRPTRFCDGQVTVPGVDRGFAALRRAGAIRVVPRPTRIDGARVLCGDGVAIDADLVVFATGYRYVLPGLPPDVATTPRGIPKTRDGQSVSHPGLWFVGLPCARSAASQYLYGIARDAPYVAGRIAIPPRTLTALS